MLNYRMLGVLKLCLMHIFCVPTSMSMNFVHAEYTLVAVHKY